MIYSNDTPSFSGPCFFRDAAFTASSTRLRIQVSANVLKDAPDADGGKQPEHALLDEVLAVPSREKIRAGAHADHAAVALYELLLRARISI